MAIGPMARAPYSKPSPTGVNTPASTAQPAWVQAAAVSPETRTTGRNNSAEASCETQMTSSARSSRLTLPP